MNLRFQGIEEKNLKRVTEQLYLYERSKTLMGPGMPFFSWHL